MIIAVISGKGGVGKTTTTANIGSGLAMCNKRVALVDFDIGQRNLDMILGLENRVIFDMVQVMDGECKLPQALIRSKINKNLHFLAASQTKDKSVLNSRKIKKLLDDLEKNFDYVILDAPAGIESGFEHTIEFCDRAVIVVNPEVSSIRDADKAIGILDSKSQKVKDGGEVIKYLLINRINAEMVQNGEMLNSEEILDLLDIPLVGKIPEDRNVIDCSNKGTPIILTENSEAGKAYMRVARRFTGEEVAFPDVENPKKGLLKTIGRIFK